MPPHALNAHFSSSVTFTRYENIFPRLFHLILRESELSPRFHETFSFLLIGKHLFCLLLWPAGYRRFQDDEANSSSFPGNESDVLMFAVSNDAGDFKDKRPQSTADLIVQECMARVFFAKVSIGGLLICIVCFPASLV